LRLSQKMTKLLLILATLLVIYNAQESAASTGSFTLLEINRVNNQNQTQNHRYQGTTEVQGFSGHYASYGLGMDIYRNGWNTEF
jgi:hypothetical protein